MPTHAKSQKSAALKSRILAGVLEGARDLHSVGAINDDRMKEFETLCLPPPPVKPYSAAKIRHLREWVHVSQAALAGYLGASVATVREWEGGKRHPSGSSLRLLNLIDRKGLAVVCA